MVKVGRLNPMKIIGAVVGIAIAFWVGETVIDAVVDSITQTVINDSTGYFYEGYQFIGLTTAESGILPIVAVIVVAGLAFKVLGLRF